VRHGIDGDCLVAGARRRGAPHPRQLVRGFPARCRLWLGRCTLAADLRFSQSRMKVIEAITPPRGEAR
jgi:hypothetical protein